ncbi:c-type cytochrome [Glaciecola petra]|uniref:Cytochrome c n=1 Tax=Glaciecola petra TaxID=3075602 RepID=A0ABU2ZRB0_9ALTE|nr:cytochrome c [Aestuariibacter sp. P117]MDT0593977.1 cytochrome c [Aestuariibacter sp. P117]
MKNKILLSTLFASLICVSGISSADNHPKATSEKQANAAVTFRKSLLQLVRSNMGPLGGMARGNIPMNAETIGKNAERVAFLASMMHDYFELDTTAFDVNTDAKSSIWKNKDDFNAKIDDMVSAAAKLQDLVAKNDEGNFRKGIGALGATCKACHDEYKKD